MNFKTITPEELIQFVAHASPEILEVQIGKMDKSQVRSTIVAINEANDGNWRKKTRAAITGLNERPELEIAGGALTIPQVFELLDTCLCIEDKNHWKLSPIIVGMTHETFVKYLMFGTEKEIAVLKHESVTEPVQHHLIVFSHELENQIKDLEIQMFSLSRSIENLNVNELSRHEVQNLVNQIDDLAINFNHTMDKINSVLSIAWNTNRTDLIEALNFTKEHCHKCMIHGEKGLHLALKHRLFRVYHDHQKPHDIESVKEEEPAIEGISKLEVWYLRDYLDLNLLPGIKKPEELDLDLSKHSEQERKDHRERLFSLARNTLEEMGLITVNDLKDNYIFSKKTLKEYIEKSKATTSA